MKEFVTARLEAMGRGPVELATLHGLQRNFINDLLLGRKKAVGGRNLGKLARALEVDATELLAVMSGEARELHLVQNSEQVPESPPRIARRQPTPEFFADRLVVEDVGGEVVRLVGYSESPAGVTEAVRLVMSVSGFRSALARMRKQFAAKDQ